MSYTVVIPSKTYSNLIPCVRAIRERGEDCHIKVIDDGVQQQQPYEEFAVAIDMDRPRALTRGRLGIRQSILHKKRVAREAGVDEAGRGACAGPLVAAAVLAAVSTKFWRTSLARATKSRTASYASRSRDTSPGGGGLGPLPRSGLRIAITPRR